MNPYPFLYRIDGRSIPGVPRSVNARLKRDCDRVYRLTGRKAYYHLLRGTVLFMLSKDLDRGGSAEEVVFDSGRWLPINTQRVTNECRMCDNMNAQQKKRLVARGEKSHDEARARYARDHADNVLDEFRSVARYLVRKHQSRHSRPIITVPGRTTP